MGRFEDLTNKKFGEWTVLELDTETMEKRKLDGKAHRTLWKCKCSCGDVKTVPAGDLKSGKSLSCGHSKYEVIGQKVSESRKGKNEYDLSGEYGIGYTMQGKCFYFDKEDYELIKGYYWYIKRGYAVSNNNGNQIKMHRLIMSAPKGKVIDHINRQRNDNRKENLRICTQLENCRNVSKRKDTKGYLGVNKDGNKWRVRITVNGKRLRLGTYDTYEEAVEKRKEAELKYWGEIIDR